MRRKRKKQPRCNWPVYVGRLALADYERITKRADQEGISAGAWIRRVAMRELRQLPASGGKSGKTGNGEK